jgi:hypothetical protein
MSTKMSLGRSATLGIAVLATLTITAPQAHAGFIATIQQVGSNVVITGSGTINTAALTLGGATGNESFVYPDYPALLFDASGATYSLYSLASTGPSNYGSGAETFTSSASGAAVGFEQGGFDEIALPVGYTSGASLSDSMTFAGTTIAALGITPGTYIWTWGSVGNESADFFEITTNATSAVPEPASMVLVGSAMLGLLALRRRIAR